MPTAAAQGSTAEPLVKIKDVSVARGGRVLVSDLTLSIHTGELISIVGPNGGGKTTTLKLIVGAIEPSSGTVSHSSSLSIGYQPQKSIVEEHVPLTVENLLRMADSKISNDSILAKLEVFSLQPTILKRQIANLSGGERQCVMVIRAMLKSPKLLALDEPGTYCDQRNLSEMYARIEEYGRSAGCATVVVSHDISRVLAHSDHVYCINKRLVCEGGPNHIVKDTEFESIYGETGHAGIYRHRH